MDTNHMAMEIDLECDLPVDPRWGLGVPVFLITCLSKTHQPLFEIPDSFPAQLLTLLEGKGELWFLSFCYASIFSWRFSGPLQGIFAWVEWLLLRP